MAALFLAGGVLLGGHILYTLTNTKEIITYIDKLILLSKTEEITPTIIIAVLQKTCGGMVFYGGFIGASVVIYTYTKHKKSSPKYIISDTFAVCVPLFHTFGRIGCFLGGCCYGIESRFGFVAKNSIIEELNGIRRFPTPLLESFFNLILFLLLFFLLKKDKLSGKLFYLYLVIYPIGRFLIEFLRGDTIRGFILGLSTSQWISIVLLICGIILFTTSKKAIQKAKQADPLA